MSTIKDLNLAESGERKIRWVEAHMPVLRDIGSDFAREKPFAGLKIALSVHLEAKTAYLCRVLEMGGAEMHVTGSNPLSTQALHGTGTKQRRLHRHEGDALADSVSSGRRDLRHHHGRLPHG